MTYPIIYIHIDSSFFVTRQIFQSHGKNCWGDVFCLICDVLPGWDLDLLMWQSSRDRTWVSETGHLYHLSWFSKYWCFGLGSVVFIGLLGDFLNSVFINFITAVQNLKYQESDQLRRKYSWMWAWRCQVQGHDLVMWQTVSDFEDVICQDYYQKTHLW